MSDLVSKLSMRRVAPFAAVLVLAGPGAALAASPAPDTAPSGAELAPDPVPATPAPTPAHRTTAASPRSQPVTHSTPAPRTRYVPVFVPTRQVVTQPVQQAKTAAAAPVHKPKAKPATRPVHVKKAHKDPVVPIVDVVPLRVDVHPTLGAIASNVRNDGQLVLAAAALLAAVIAAASGAALAFVGRRPA